MENKKIFLFLVIVSLFIFKSQFLYSQEWIRITQNERQYTEVDVSSIKRGENTFTVWIKTGYRTLSAKEYYIDRKVFHLEKQGVKVDRGIWNDWAYTLLLQEFDCNTSRFRIITEAEYRDDGSVIQRLDFKAPNEVVADIAPGSTADDISKALCKLYYLEYMGKVYGLFYEDALEIIRDNDDIKVLE